MKHITHLFNRIDPRADTDLNLPAWPPALTESLLLFGPPGQILRYVTATIPEALYLLVWHKCI